METAKKKRILDVVNDRQMGVSDVRDFGVAREDDGVDEGVEGVQHFEAVFLDEILGGVLRGEERMK